MLGFKGSFSTVKCFVRQKKDDILWESPVRFKTLPGEQAQVDFSEI